MRLSIVVLLIIAGVSTFFSGSVQAENIPTTADLVLTYITEAETTKHNYLFTIEGDNTIYTCLANRCGLGRWSDRAGINLTIYVLPEGFTAVSRVVDPAVLQLYLAKAEKTYVLNSIVPSPATSNGRGYQTVVLRDDGSVEIETNTYVKPDVKEQRAAQKKTQTKEISTPAQQILVISAIGIAIVLLGIWLWRHWRARRLRS